MPDLSVIKNEKLRNLIQASSKFKALSEFQQLKHLAKFQNLSPEQEEKVCDFLAKENAKENKNMTNEEKLEVLSRLYSELVELEAKFTKLLKQEPENKQHEDDQNNMNNLLGSLSHP